MNQAPQLYGFRYRHNNRTFALGLIAESSEDAMARIAAIASAEFVGELCPQEDATTADG